jgi:hypothetical protein
MKKYTCPCCGYKTIYREETFYDLCPVCYWETDPYQLENPDYKGGANRPSLMEAQQNFILFGACEKEIFSYTRLPLKDEPKDENFQTFDEKAEGSLFFKRYWNESTGSSKTNDWGTAFYYFETDEKGKFLKQIVVYENDKTLKYSNLYLEDEFGGLATEDLDLTDKDYISMVKNDFFDLWNSSKMETFAKNKLCFLGWNLPVFQEKILFPNPEFKEDELLISATLDHRFMLDLTYQKGGEHFPIHGFFLLDINEGHTGIHYFTYMNWKEAVAATQHWIDEIQAANKTVDVPKAAEEQAFDVRVNIDNQIVISKLTTWRNMDWEVGKYRNIKIQIDEELYSIIDTFTDFENMILALQKSLPKNYKIETCFFCRFSSYNPAGNDDFGTLDCFKNCKAAFVKANNKQSLFDLYEKRKKNNIFRVEETDYCNEFRWIKGNEWAFKNQMKD